MTTIDIIYDNLMDGKRYGYVLRNVRFPVFHTILCKHWCKPIFCWNHYGSSANKATKKELQWIIEVIFKVTPEEFVNKFECRTYEESLKEVME